MIRGALKDRQSLQAWRRAGEFRLTDNLHSGAAPCLRPSMVMTAVSNASIEHTVEVHCKDRPNLLGSFFVHKVSVRNARVRYY
jgi:hypothetical protein